MVKQHRAPHPKNCKTKRLSNQVTVTIPFNNGAELEAKFNEFFNPTSKKNSEAITSKATELPNIDSQMSLTQNNLLFLLRNRLSYDLICARSRSSQPTSVLEILS